MLSVLRNVINPGVGLLKTIENWPEISFDLQERSRVKRTRQLCAFK